MKQKRNRRLIKIAITVCSLGIVCFVLFFFVPIDDMLPGRDKEVQTASPVPSDTLSEAAGTEGVSEPSAGPVPQTPAPELPDISMYRPQLTGDDLITVRMDESDIHDGFLLLVNSDHRYDIPDDLDLASIVNARTSDFRVRSNNYRLHSGIMAPLNEMMDGFISDTDKSYMFIVSAYRDLYAQRLELNEYIYLYGRQAALLHVSEPGYSEHHTGLAFDLGTYVDGVRYPFDFFDKTTWFFRNAYKYGFVLRYPNGKTNITGTAYEPWHYRYVGLPHSAVMYNNNLVLEEYISKLRGYTQDEPLKTEYNGVDYEIYFTDSTYINVPAQAQYEISGNNVDGFIVTIFNRYDRLTNVAAE